MAVGTRMQQRRATEADWNVSDYVLEPGELGVTTDTAIIKIGDGLNTWTNLDPAFDTQYLPALGKAADSELLDGIGSEGFAQVGDVPTNTEFTDGLAETLASSRIDVMGRVLTADFTFAVTDTGKCTVVSNSSWTTVVATIPTNASVAMPVGSVLTLSSVNKGAAKFTPAGGVTLRGNPMVFGGNSTTRIVKTATDEWLVLYQAWPRPAMAKRFVTDSFSLPVSAHTVMTLSGTATGVNSKSSNYDSLGTNEQWSSGANDRLICRREGWYHVEGRFHINAASTVRYMATPYVNGTAQHAGQAVYNEQSLTGVGFTAELPLSENDYVQMYGYQNSAAAKTIQNDPASPSYLQWRWVAPL